MSKWPQTVELLSGKRPELGGTSFSPENHVLLHTVASATTATTATSFSSSAAELANAAESKWCRLNTFIEIMLWLSSWQQSISAFSDVETKKKKIEWLTDLYF